MRKAGKVARYVVVSLVASIVVVFFAGWVFLSNVNSYQLDGEISLSVLTDPVTVHRDEHGVPYIFAQNEADLYRSLGFVVAQDRVFFVELYRNIISGNLASLIGDAGLKSDIRMKVVGISENAKRHAKFLSEESKEVLSWFAEGYNAFLSERSEEFPVELGLMGIEPKLMQVEDMLAIQHYLGFVQGRNMSDEILSLNLAAALGSEKALELLPLNINPDRIEPVLKSARANVSLAIKFADNSEANLPVNHIDFGSNNWVTSSKKSKGAMPILSNDPHLDASILPGPWYPVGLFTPEIKAVGATIPGVPGILTGRTEHLAFGVTNAYGDSQDLYLERLDADNPQNYMDGGLSMPFERSEVAIKVKDGDAESGYREEKIVVRQTKRGPVVSDHPIFGLPPDQPVVLRWALSEITRGGIGAPGFLTARNVNEFDQRIGELDILYLNFVFADKKGDIAHRASGLIPIRANGETAKQPAAQDDWTGFIPKDQMPGQKNPDRGWLGTANNDIIPDNYPFYYSAHFSPDYRYQRMAEVLNENGKFGVDDHWALTLDVVNKHAELLVPILIEALAADSSTKPLADILTGWDFRDGKDSVAATVFHVIHEHLIRAMLQDDLPEPLLERYLKSRYYWLQRTADLFQKGNSHWFDNSDTNEIESRSQIIVEAGKRADFELSQKLGDDREDWTWGDFHTVSFVSPLRRDGIGKGWLGGGTHGLAGSGETLQRGHYVPKDGPYSVSSFASLRIVSDLSDDEKVLAIVSGGNAARQFHPFFKSHLDIWLNNQWSYWWLDPEKIAEQSKHKLELMP